MSYSGQVIYNRKDLIGLGVTVSDTTLLRWEANGRFPRRMKLAGTRVAWLAEEIRQWLEDAAADRKNLHYAEM